MESPQKDHDCTEDEKRKHAESGEGEVSRLVSAVIEDVIADDVVVVAFRIVGGELWIPFTAEIKRKGDCDPRQGWVYRVERISFLIEEFDSGGYVAGFVKCLGGVGICETYSNDRNQNE